MSRLTIERLHPEAEKLGLIIDEDHVEDPHCGRLEGYWLIDPETGEGPFEDGNFSTSLEEVAGKLIALELTRQ